MAREAMVFHCPACAADRVGEVGRGTWTSWLRRDNQGAHLTCVGCRRMFQRCAVQHGPVGTSHRARINLAVRAMAASVVVAGHDDPRTWSAALEFVRSCSTLSYTHGDLRADVSDPSLPIRLRGDLTLLATCLHVRGAAQLVHLLRAVVETPEVTTPAQRAVLAACARYLGVRPPSARDRREPLRLRPER